MVSNSTIANILGTIGTVFWCIQLTPQIYFLWRRKNSEGFPPIFMFLWAVSGVPFAIYFISTDSYIPMQVQPQLFTVLCSIAWVQSMYYPPHSYPKKKWLTYTVCFFAAAVVLEVSFGVPLRIIYKRGTHWPPLIFGVIASILLVAGLIPPYFELSRRHGRVVGINFFFLIMDTSGAVFSMASNLVDKIDVMGMILYCLVIVMEVGIYASQIIWLIRFRLLKKGGDIEEGSTTESQSDSMTEAASSHPDTPVDVVVTTNEKHEKPQ